LCILQSPLFTDIQTTPSDEETSVKAGDTKRKLEPSVCPHTLVYQNKQYGLYLYLFLSRILELIGTILSKEDKQPV
jgi:hypothetical protein